MVLRNESILGYNEISKCKDELLKCGFYTKGEMLLQCAARHKWLNFD